MKQRMAEGIFVIIGALAAIAACFSVAFYGYAYFAPIFGLPNLSSWETIFLWVVLRSWFGNWNIRKG